MAVEVGTAYVAILPSAKGFASALAGEIVGPSEAIGDEAGSKAGGTYAAGFKKAVKGMIAIAVGSQIAQFFKESFQLAADAEQSIGGAETVFGQYADTIVKKSKTAASEYGLSANQYRESANLIGSLFRNQGVETDQLAGKTDDMIGVAADLSAAFGGTAKEAVEALASAYKGEYDPLERYGISLKQSTVNAYLAAHGQDTLTGSALAQAQQAAITAIITEQAGGALGQFGRESDTAANRQQVLTAKWEDAKSTLGSALLPVMTAVFGFLADHVVPILASVAEWVSRNIDWFGPLVGAILAGAAAFKILNAVMEANLFAKIVSLVIAAAIAIISNWNAIVDFLAGVWNWIANLATTVWSAIASFFTGLWQSIWGGIVAAWNAIVAFFAAIWAGISATATAVWTGIWTFLSGLWNIIASTANAIWTGIWTTLTTIWGWISTAANTVWGVVRDYIIGPISEAWTWLGTAFQSIYDTVSGILQNLSDFISSIWEGIKNIFRGAVNFLIRILNGFIDAINWFAKKYNELMDVLMWEQIFGYSGHIPTLDHIPYLAEGGLVKASSGGTLAVLGEGGRDELVIPLAKGTTMQEAMAASDAVQGKATELTQKWLQENVLDKVGGFDGLADEVSKRKFGQSIGAKALASAPAGTAAPGALATPPGGLAEWVRQAMSITGAPANWLEPLVGLAMHESGGNPAAINLWDSNAAAGIPSQGLFQTIPSTFAAYGMGGSITDPVANAVAAIRYIMARYGTIFNIPSYRGNGSFVGGYRYGGTVDRTGYAYVHKGETVVPAGENTGGPTYQVQIDAAPTVPTEDQIVRVLRNVDFLHGVR